MKKVILCAAAALICGIVLLCISSCETASVPEFDETDGADNSNEINSYMSGGADTAEKDPPKVNNAKYKRFYEDDTVYNTNMYTGYSVIFASIHTTNCTLGEVLLDSPGEALYLHDDPTCDHESIRCPMASESMSDSIILVFDAEYRDQPLIYYFARHTDSYYDEENDKETHGYVTDIREYDVGTGEVRELATVPVNVITNAWLYRGKLYFTSKWSGFLPYWNNIGVVDIGTGEYTIIDPGFGARMIGITNGRVWYITEENMIGSCSLGLDDMRDEYDIGPTTLRNDAEFVLRARADNGVIYFERACRAFEETDGKNYSSDCVISDVYMLDAADIASGERLVDENVIAFDSYDGDLYYTKTNFMDMGVSFSDGTTGGNAYDICTCDGGTLYKYDPESGEVTTCYSDIGVDISMLGEGDHFEVVDGYAIFSGKRYRDIEEAGRISEYICLVDMETGEWQALYPYKHIAE